MKEVQAIKGAVQEHLLFIGMDNQNNIKNIEMIGIGCGQSVVIDPKYIVRNALINSCDRVVLVHNHPSNSLEISKEDKLASNIINNLMNCFNISLIDHIIVSDKGYKSMIKEGAIDYSYEIERLKLLDKSILENENNELKKEVEHLKERLEQCESIIIEERKSMQDDNKIYDHVSILSGKLNAEDIKKEIEKYEQCINENNMKIVSFENMGLKKLAYDIKDNSQGNYIVYKLYGNEEQLKNLEKYVRNNDNIIKFISIATDEEYSEMEREEM